MTQSVLGTRAAQQATAAIPIVMGIIADPVRPGVVKSLARPGGNTTGVATLQFDLAAERLELFKEALPTLRRVAVLLNARNPGGREDLRGERPATLPVQQSVKTQLVINLKTSKTLGVTVPPSLLVRADEIIQ